MNFVSAVSQPETRKGFTLIEVMVVIAIIAVLMSGGVLAFVNAQKNSRDARRIRDIRAISQALEQYRNTNGTYPTAATSINNSTYFGSGTTPTDPTATKSYTIALDATNGTGYCVCAMYDVLGKGNSTTLPSGAVFACTFATPGAGVQGYQCIQNQQ